ncbi:MAG: alpha/beta hydrolase [Chitinophagaceae bacterium]
MPAVKDNDVKMQPTRFVHYKKSSIAYHVYGQGKAPVFCLHGFSLTGSAYAGLGKLCSPGKMLFALDFPLHGQTDWKEAELTADILLQIFQLITQQELNTELERFDLMGHSMGGRIALYMYQCFPEKVTKLLLLAPDGLKRSFGHRFLFRTQLGPKIFKRLSDSSKRIMALTHLAYQSHIINRSVYNLIRSSYEDEDTAHLVYARLMVTRHFYPDATVIKKEINDYKTPVYLFFGQYDSIVPCRLGKYLKEGAEDFVQIQTLLSGHLLLANEETLADIAAAIG